MNINRMTDEDLAKELRKVGEANNVTVIFGGQQMWPAVAKFIRQCVKDSRKELVEALKALYNDTTRLENWEKAEQALASVEGER